MKKSDLSQIRSLHLKMQAFLKSEIQNRLLFESYRDLEKVTGLNSKQIQRILKDNYPNFQNTVSAVEKLISS